MLKRSLMCVRFAVLLAAIHPAGALLAEQRAAPNPVRGVVVDMLGVALDAGAAPRKAPSPAPSPAASPDPCAAYRKQLEEYTIRQAATAADLLLTENQLDALADREVELEKAGGKIPDAEAKLEQLRKLRGRWIGWKSFLARDLVVLGNGIRIMKNHIRRGECDGTPGHYNGIRPPRPPATIP